MTVFSIIYIYIEHGVYNTEWTRLLLCTTKDVHEYTDRLNKLRPPSDGFARRSKSRRRAMQARFIESVLCDACCVDWIETIYILHFVAGMRKQMHTNLKIKICGVSY